VDTINRGKTNTQHRSTNNFRQPHHYLAEAHLVILIGVPLPLLVPPVNALSSLRLLRGICCLALIRLNWRPGYHRASVYTRNAICCDDMNSIHTLDTDPVQLTQDEYCDERGQLWCHPTGTAGQLLHNQVITTAVQRQVAYTQLVTTVSSEPHVPAGRPRTSASAWPEGQRYRRR
jgi:hypothetical protein